MQTLAKAPSETSHYARHVVSKIAVNLHRLQRLAATSVPSDTDISALAAEAALLLDRGYLGTIIYGYIRGTNWAIAQKYRALGVQWSSHTPSGSLIYPTPLADVTFASFLTYSQNWHALSKQQKAHFESQLPVQRTSVPEPDIKDGAWVETQAFRSGKFGLACATI